MTQLCESQYEDHRVGQGTSCCISIGQWPEVRQCWPLLLLAMLLNQEFIVFLSCIRALGDCAYIKIGLTFFSLVLFGRQSNEAPTVT